MAGTISDAHPQMLIFTSILSIYTSQYNTYLFISPLFGNQKKGFIRKFKKKRKKTNLLSEYILYLVLASSFSPSSLVLFFALFFFSPFLQCTKYIICIYVYVQYQYIFFICIKFDDYISLVKCLPIHILAEFAAIWNDLWLTGALQSVITKSYVERLK